MYRRIISVVLLIVLIMCCCAACTQNEDEMPQNALSVYCPSDEITYIVPGEYPANYAEDGEAFKWGYNVFVSKMNADDKLVLSANRNEGLGRTSLTSSGTYYKSFYSEKYKNRMIKTDSWWNIDTGAAMEDGRPMLLCLDNGKEYYLDDNDNIVEEGN